jgi:hypothetical protein
VDDLHHIILVLVTQLKDNSILLGLVHEKVLNLPVLLEESLDDMKLSVLLTLSVHVENLGQRSQSTLEKVNIASINVVVEELVEGLVQSLGGELAMSRLATLNNLSELGVKLLRHARMEGRELRVPLAEGQFIVSENLDQFLQCVVHDDRVVVTQENILKGVVEKGVSLSGFGTNNHGLAIGRELVNESLGLLHAARIVESEDTQNITSLEGSSRLLDKLDNTIFLGNKRHVHLHDLNFGKSLASANMGAVLNRVLDELTRAGRSKLGGVVLLLEQASLAVN